MSIAPPYEVEQAGLVYVTDQIPGIRRKRSGKGFSYTRTDGSLVKDAATLKRIRSLAIPPAYVEVWICPLSEGHLQATGLDARGRKQYRYHPRFRETRDMMKFQRLIDFGEALPKVRDRVQKDLRKQGFPREKVLAAIVYLLEKSLIRVGNEEYAKENKSFGLTTLRNRHVQVQGETVAFNFLGKSKIKHNIELHDRRLARVVKALQDLPGQELFQYLDEAGETRSVSSSDVNLYLKEIAGEEFSAKDFRTWAGTVLALTELSVLEPSETKRGQKSGVTSVLKVVAKQLGNTPTVCRKCYVHPVVLEAYGSGHLSDLLKKRGIERSPEAAADIVDCAEDAVLDLLREHREEMVTSGPQAYVA